MKRLIFVFAFLAFAACSKPEEEKPTVIPVESVSLSETSMSIAVGQSKTLTATVLPENASDKTVKWSSSDTCVATVNNYGLVTALAEGTATISANASGKTADCAVSVLKDKKLVKAVSFNPKSLKISAGDSTRLSMQVSPSDFTETYHFLSSDEKVARVSAAGVVTALHSGTADITVVFDESAVSAKCAVTVTSPMTITRLDASEIRTSDREAYYKRLGSRTDTICVARGEVASVQLNIKAEDNLGDIQSRILYFCPADTEEGIAITPKSYWIGKVYATKYWQEWQGGAPYNGLDPTDRLFPDILIPADKATKSISKSDNNGFWYEFSIPDNFPAGLYKGGIEISVEASGKRVAETQEFYVEVFPVTLPEKQELIVVNWEQDEFSAIGATDNREALGRLVEFMNDYGQNAWPSGMGDTRLVYCPATIEGDKIVYDFSSVIDEINFFDAHCKDLKMYQGWCFCAYEDMWNPHGPEYLKIPTHYIDDSGNLKFEGLPSNDPRVSASLTDLYSQFSEVLHNTTLSDGRALIDVYVQSIMDEPYDRHKEGYEIVASAIKAGCPDIKILEATEAPSISEDLLDWPCPNLDRLSTRYDDYKARGNQQQWLYVCLRPQGNVANRLFGQKVIFSRFLHWCNYRFNAIGYLHWALNRWANFTWTNTCFPTDAYDATMPTSPAGDHFIVYPGNNEFYPSIRLCNQRDGINDFELLKMIGKIDPAKAMEFCYRVVYEKPVECTPSAVHPSGQYRYYDEDIRHFRETRREMLEYLSGTER